jgi:hypothetical protein
VEVVVDKEGITVAEEVTEAVADVVEEAGAGVEELEGQEYREAWTTNYYCSSAESMERQNGRT